MKKKWKERKKRVFLLWRSKKIERNDRKRRKAKLRRKRTQILKERQDKRFRDSMMGISSFKDALEKILPKNLTYIISKSEYNSSNLLYIYHPYREEIIVRIPKVFSIIENPKESYNVVSQVIEVFIHQRCSVIAFNYNECIKIDLLTQVFFDAVLKDISEFLDLIDKAKLGHYCRLRTLRAFGYRNVHKIINTVGSPVILINRQSDYPGVKPFRLSYFDAEGSTYMEKMSRKELDTTSVIDYIDACLNVFHRKLSRSALQQLGYVIGEILINAEEHSSTKARYMIGYMEEMNVDKGFHTGVFNLVIMNFGKTIYEVFKYPDAYSTVNLTSLSQMKALSNNFTRKGFLSLRGMSEETLWTLYSLQQGVTSIPGMQRGNGTIQFIESFFKLKDKDHTDIDNVSRMYLLSGKTLIEFNGEYRLKTIDDGNGLTRDVISFNKSGSIFDKPDTRYVRTVDDYFPGTALYVRLLLNDKDFINEKND